MNIMKMVADEVLSDEAKDEFLDELNKSIDVPIISEKTERAIMEAIWKIVKGLFMKKLGLAQEIRMKAIASLLLVSILNSIAPDSVVYGNRFNDTEVASSEIKKKKKKSKKKKKKSKKKKKKR